MIISPPADNKEKQLKSGDEENTPIIEDVENENIVCTTLVIFKYFF